MSTFTAPKGIQLKLVSPSEEVLGILSDTDESATILDAQIKVLRIGGVDTFSFKIARDTDIPITRNTVAYFYIQGTLWFLGYVKEIPQPDQTDPVLVVEGEGFYRRLTKKIIHIEYAAQTLDAIVKDVGSNYLGTDVGVFYDVAKIDVPVVANITIEFYDKTLLDVFTTLLSICNYDYNTTKYRFYVDNNRDLVFEELEEDPPANLFEGYRYFKPEVSQDWSKTVNKILAFRTESLDTDVVEYVATYQDTDSQGRFGLYEKKITFPDFVDTATIAKIANAILERRALPQDKVAIKQYELNLPFIVSDIFVVDTAGELEDLLVDTDGLENTLLIVDSELVSLTLPFEFGNYGLSNKRAEYWKLIADCDTLVGWDTVGLTNTVLTLSEIHVLTGKRSLKFVTAAGSSGEYASFTLDNAIPLPQKVRLFIYMESVAPTIKVMYEDEDGNELDIDFSSLVDQWVKLTEDSVQLTQVVDLDCDTDGLQDELIQVDMDGAPNLQLEVRDEVEPGLLLIKKVTITILTDNVTTFYIDRLDTYASVHQYRKLQLEEVMYNLSSSGLFANLNFGEKEDSLLDEIKDSMKEGNLALGIFSKKPPA